MLHFFLLSVFIFTYCVYLLTGLVIFDRILDIVTKIVIPQSVKNLLAMQETWVQFLDLEDPLEKEMATAPVFWPGESHGQRSLASHSPWSRKSRT